MMANMVLLGFPSKMDIEEYELYSSRKATSHSYSSRVLLMHFRCSCLFLSESRDVAEIGKETG